ncbi:hypothetical protein AB5I41_11590 [Sphingomonas sp. MMS24-JH45]
MTKDQAFADKFFTQTIAGSTLPDLAPLVAQAGFTLASTNPGKGWIGRVGFATAMVRSWSPAIPRRAVRCAPARLDKDDRLLAIDGTPVVNAADATARLTALAPGATATLRFVQRGAERDGTLTVAADPAVTLVPLAKPTAAQRRFRKAWLGV